MHGFGELGLAFQAVFSKQATVMCNLQMADGGQHRAWSPPSPPTLPHHKCAPPLPPWGCSGVWGAAGQPLWGSKLAAEGVHTGGSISPAPRILGVEVPVSHLAAKCQLTV